MPDQPAEQQPTYLAAAPADPAAEHWHTYARTGYEDTPKRLEEAAKFLTGLIGLTLTLTLNNDFYKPQLPPGAIPPAPDAWVQGLLGAALCGWVLSLAAALFVVFPARYRYVAASAESIRGMHGRVVRRKYAWLVVSAVAYVAALALVGLGRWWAL